MSTEKRKIKLQLIRSPKRVGVSEEQFSDPAGQGLLFPLPKRDLLIFLVVPRVTEEEFTKTLEVAKPTIILELRRSHWPNEPAGGVQVVRNTTIKVL